MVSLCLTSALKTPKMAEKRLFIGTIDDFFDDKENHLHSSDCEKEETILNECYDSCESQIKKIKLIEATADVKCELDDGFDAILNQSYEKVKNTVEKKV